MTCADDTIELFKDGNEVFNSNQYWYATIRDSGSRIQKGINAMIDDIKRRKEEVRVGFDSLRRTDFFRNHNFSLNPKHGPGREIRDFLD